MFIENTFCMFYVYIYKSILCSQALGLIFSTIKQIKHINIICINAIYNITICTCIIILYKYG